MRHGAEAAITRGIFIERGLQGGAIGVLLLVVGYFAPLPPRKAEPEQVNA